MVVCMFRSVQSVCLVIERTLVNNNDTDSQPFRTPPALHTIYTSILVLALLFLNFTFEKPSLVGWAQECGTRLARRITYLAFK